MENQSVSQNRIKENWKSFITGQPIREGVIRPEILESWKRCHALGVNPSLKAPSRLTDPREIALRLEKNREMLEIALPAVQHLYQFLHDAGLFVAISDADGYLLSIYGATTLIDPNHDILYTAWSEERMGNNPIGTAIHDNRPLQVSGYEHYCMFPHHFSGAGAPIHAPDGSIIGAISITHKTDNPHPHTLAMIVMTSYSIEAQLGQQDSARATALAYQHLQALVDALSEGLLVLDHTGKVIMANGTLLKQFHVKEEELLGKDIKSLIPDSALNRAIARGSVFTDKITDLHVCDNTYPCVVTYRTVSVGQKMESLVILSDLNRAQKLASKLNDPQANKTFDNIICISSSFRRVLDDARRLAATDSNILILGESGTGKDVLAQAIHNESPRRNGPFIPINCGAIQRELIQSELFGYEEGAFTGAKRGGSIGRLEAANGGTVFLDEIGEMPLELQPILLRAIEHKVISRVGGKAFIPLNVRIIAATNRDLYRDVADNRFRQDLYYRLNVFTIILPPLRERLEDVPALASRFINRMNLRYGKSVNGFTKEATEVLCQYSWPGNVRELQNCVERCVVLATDPLMDTDLLPPEVVQAHAVLTGENPATDFAAAPPLPKGSAGDAEELIYLLEHFHWNITKVSQYLNVTRATVYRRMERFHIQK